MAITCLLYGYETWSHTKGDTETGGVENRVVRRIFGPKRDEVAGEDCTMRSFVTCTLHQILLG
jgi:hypothetical protein